MGTIINLCLQRLANCRATGQYRSPLVQVAGLPSLASLQPPRSSRRWGAVWSQRSLISVLTTEYKPDILQPRDFGNPRSFNPANSHYAGYQSRPPLCPEVVMYQSGPTPVHSINNTMQTQRSDIHIHLCYQAS